MGRACIVQIRMGYNLCRDSRTLSYLELAQPPKAALNQNYIRDETLIAANANLVSAQNQIPLAHAWGGGEVASADGIRFVVPIRTVHAGPNPKYFGVGSGVTYLPPTSLPA